MIPRAPGVPLFLRHRRSAHPYRPLLVLRRGLPVPAAQQARSPVVPGVSPVRRAQRERFRADPAE